MTEESSKDNMTSWRRLPSRSRSQWNIKPLLHWHFIVKLHITRKICSLIDVQTHAGSAFDNSLHFNLWPLDRRPAIYIYFGVNCLSHFFKPTDRQTDKVMVAIDHNIHVLPTNGVANDNLLFHISSDKLYISLLPILFFSHCPVFLIICPLCNIMS